MELAHVNRVTTMGQLTASIAHEARGGLSGPDTVIWYSFINKFIVGDVAVLVTL